MQTSFNASRYLKGGEFFNSKCGCYHDATAFYLRAHNASHSTAARHEEREKKRMKDHDNFKIIS